MTSAYCHDLNPNGGTLTGDTRDNEYVYRVPNSGSVQVVSFDIWTQSTGGTVSVPAHLYASSGNAPAVNPTASTTISVGTGAGFYTATFAAPVTMTGDFYLGLDSSAQNVVVCTLSSGDSGVAFWRDLVQPSWTQSVLVQAPSWRVNCTGTAFETPKLGNTGLPILGQSYSVTLADAVPSSFAFLLTGVSSTIYQGMSLPIPLPGAPGCNIHAAPNTTQLVVTTAPAPRT